MMQTLYFATTKNLKQEENKKRKIIHKYKDKRSKIILPKRQKIVHKYKKKRRQIMALMLMRPTFKFCKMMKDKKGKKDKKTTKNSKKQQNTPIVS